MFPECAEILRTLQAERPPVPACFQPPLADEQPALPHGPPFLFIDRVCHVDRPGRLLVAEHHLDPDDPVFHAHFPGRPVFPGSLLVEAAGQAVLALLTFVPAAGWPTPVDRPVLTRVYDARFLDAAGPGDCLLIEARVLDLDEFRLVGAARVFRGQTLLALAALEIFNALS